jgi:hypothetical protein
MTVFFGSSADRGRPLGVVRGLAVVVAALVLAGCSGASGETSKTPTPKARVDEGMRNTIKAALTQAGRTFEAGIVSRGGARLTQLNTPFLKSWKIIQVDYRQDPHPTMFHVAVGGSQAHLLTGTPAAFSTVTKADGTHVADPATAAQLGKIYIETTRPAGKLTYLVDSVDAIRFRPGITGTAAARRDEIVKKYQHVVTSPVATAKGTGFTVIAYVVRDRALQKRDLTVTAQGSVEEKIKTLVLDLPVPYTL